MGRKRELIVDFRAFRYGIYFVPAYRTGRPKGTKFLNKSFIFYLYLIPNGTNNTNFFISTGSSDREKLI
jgi:hypothetical protein